MKSDDTKQKTTLRLRKEKTSGKDVKVSDILNVAGITDDSDDAQKNNEKKEASFAVSIDSDQAYFKEEVDQWIKGFQQDLSLFSTELDDLGDEFTKQKEENLLFYEQLTRVEGKVDRLQDAFNKILAYLPGNQEHPVSDIQKIKDRAV